MNIFDKSIPLPRIKLSEVPTLVSVNMPVDTNPGNKVVKDPVVTEVVTKIIEEKRASLKDGQAVQFLQRISFDWIPGGAVSNPVFNISTAIPLPYKTLELKKINAMMFNNGAGGALALPCIIVLGSNGQAIPTQPTFGAPTPAGVVSTQRNNAWFSTGGINSGSYAGGMPILDTPPYRFYQSGFTVLIYSIESPSFSATDSVQFTMDLLFDVIEK